MSGPSVAIVGSGFSGLGLAIALKRAGCADLTVFERADDLGGVWRENTYPGAACDAPSHLYSYSFEPKHDWSRRFAPQPEILDYLRSCARKYGVTEHIRFGAEVTAADFDAATGRWTVRTAGGDACTADVLVSACGQLSRPSLPGIPGLETFAGTAFHSARWDHGHDLAGRRIAVIGNGASAVQFVPRIAPRAARLTVFQREPQWVGWKWDRRYPRLRSRLNRRFPVLQRLSRLGVFLWFEVLLNPMLISPRGRRVLSAHVRAMCRATRRSVRDERTRRDLTPRYELGCKRVLVSSDYYPALNLPHVDVVTSPIAEVTPDAVVTADGTAHQVDTIIMGTGFRSHDFVAPMRVTGLDGRALDDAWRDGPRAYLGLAVAGFPNFFLMYGPNTNVGSGSVVHMLESQIAYIVQAVRALRDPEVLYMDVRERVLSEFDERLQRRLDGTVWNAGGCTSWYVGDGRRNASNWPGSMLAYRRRTRGLDPSDYRFVKR
ncbi:Predicted flavoprotein CzcO associated with the cation diffusion facilitator CzcD [Actinomadura meyerae]|jgi:cation diffusion facilitator CzcD-associated flavoprotein CzcO|uniref:Predicted flavoprotein CzcO associated with the cation diffusion facilitator CzcD n=1 Tax=Actinomadura meyerae TaxID=240840 RepID=A0A239LYR0_9ACTN|nr:NAD(P)/FAD-dependent oxidoreductase [Actinomadura meyerae]SNT34829.1 Predicted flavoprotein CzcO associated with the cation diffusion facilitator CzcD [Actinomadura meyerae]